MAKQAPRKKLPKELAVINADNCTGCEACLEVCPVDCIFKVQQYDDFHNLQSWCEIDLERCRDIRGRREEIVERRVPTADIEQVLERGVGGEERAACGK